MSSLTPILCVDDNDDTCEMLDLMLTQADKSYSITFVKTAEEALDLIEKQTFALYILDYRLPGMSGVELCQNLRQKDFKTPIIFFTAMAFGADRKVAIEAGATDYLIKPNDLGRFTETVRELLNNRETLAN